MIAWLFDVDGTLTNPQEKAITQKGIVSEIIKKLEANEPVCLTSGRALSWIRDKVFSEIQSHVPNKNIFENLFISAEFGAVLIHFENGEEVEEIDQEVSIPNDLLNELSQVVDSEFSDISFVDPAKVTHFTAEMKNGITVENFKHRQFELSTKLQSIVDKFPEKDKFEVHNDRIATNVKNKKLNKHLAVQKVLVWLSKKGINPDNFQVFGDSLSDFEMGRELKAAGKEFKFIYVGEEEIGDLPFKVINQGGLDKGTLEYLKAN